MNPSPLSTQVTGQAENLRRAVVNLDSALELIELRSRLGLAVDTNHDYILEQIESACTALTNLRQALATELEEAPRRTQDAAAIEERLGYYVEAR